MGSSRKQRLQVRIGPSVDELSLYNVNDDNNPAFVDSNLFVGYVLIRIKDFNGVTPNGTPPISKTPYFDKDRKRLFSFQFQGRVKEPIDGDDFVQGNMWKKKIKVPWGSNVILKLAEMLDSTFSHDVYADEPWTMSTALSSQNIIQIKKAKMPIPKGPISRELGERLAGQFWGGVEELEEDNLYLKETANDGGSSFSFGPNDCEPRRKFFQKKKHRENVKLSPDYIYAMETFAPTVDFNTMNVHMGLTVNLQKVTGQPYVFMLKSKSRNEPLFVVECQLVDVDDEGRPVGPSEE
ncbi:UNVERIFIED_CONTAM: hypothetical protein HDU68_000122 [Siphonaria sp. JEL0065]|nr:hypothetical protein HDU68_000122 [Siphonaria sp. JEL0065]